MYKMAMTFSVTIQSNWKRSKCCSNEGKRNIKIGS